ncbi:MAG: hypothetical protein WCA32_07755 [Chromatiaceae bacterium]|jgi:hypothetical protein
MNVPSTGLGKRIANRFLPMLGSVETDKSRPTGERPVAAPWWKRTSDSV